MVKKIKKLCLLCKHSEHENEIFFTNAGLLNKYLNSKSMIVNRNYTCKKHMRKIRKSIILGRHLGFYAYILY